MTQVRSSLSVIGVARMEPQSCWWPWFPGRYEILENSPQAESSQGEVCLQAPLTQRKREQETERDQGRQRYFQPLNF